MRHVTIDRITQDWRYAWRGLRRTPGFTAVAIVTLALGIGASTTFFGLVDAVVFRPTAVARLDQVSKLTLHDPAASSRLLLLRFGDAQALERTPPSPVAAVTAVSQSRNADLIQTDGRAEYVLGERVSAGYARVFDLSAQAGRWIAGDDEPGRGDDVVVISDRLWRRWFRADPAIVGRATLTIGTPHRVIGVAQPGFRGIQTGLVPTEIWRPLLRPILPADRPDAPTRVAQQRSALTFIRAKPGVSPAEVRAAVAAVLTGQPDPDPVAATLALQPGAEALRITQLMALAAGILVFSGLVFLAACANLANMLYARGADRVGEIAVRLSLGARARNVFGLFLAETGIIALIAALAGLILAISATSAFSAAFPTFRFARNLGVTIDLAPDYRVFLYAFGAGTLAALVVGLLTAWRSSRVSILRAIGGAPTTNVVSSHRRGLPLSFVSVQITTAVLLLIGAGLFFENTQPLLDRRIHYDTANLAAARIRWHQVEDGVRLQHMTPEEQAQYFTEQRATFAARREAFFSTLLTQVSALPGVEVAAFTDALPGGTAPAPQWDRGILQAPSRLDSPAGLPRRVDGSWLRVSPGFLDTLGVRLVRGRGIWRTDDAVGALVAVVSQSTAAALWPNEEPIGRRLNCCRFKGQALQVVGVVEDFVSSSDRAPETRHANFVLLSAAQAGDEERFVIVRAANPAAQVEALRATIHKLAPHVPVFDVGPVDQLLLAGVALERAQRVLTMSLGLLALGLAVLGVYGVVAYFVTRRTREFGLRLALGATRRQILKMVVDYAVHIILIGLLPGVLLASLGTRLFEQQIFGIMPNSIMMWVVAPLVMLVAGIAAGLVPATRAARVDPNVTLRDL